MRFSRFVGVFVLLFVAVASAAAQQPKYVFLFIGDGMGPNQRFVANQASQAAHGKPLLIESLPVRGQIQTRSADNETTDSAAAGTALACGVKTNNGMLGQLPDGTPVLSIADRLAAAGFKTGVLSSVTLNHATPAAFYAHVPKRNMYNEIAGQFPASRIHLLIGNGMSSSDKGQDAIIEAWKAAGITAIRDLGESVPADGRVGAIIKYPAASEEKALEGPGGLAESVRFAIERLDNERGFFIMAEGGRIDWESHGNQAGHMIDEVFALDRAVAVADAFRQQRPDQTLIVITADHETGGMTVDQERLDVSRLMELVGCRKKVADALRAAGELDEPTIHRVFAETLGLNDLSESEREQITTAIAKAKEPKNLPGDLGNVASRIAQARAGVTWKTGGHTAVDVPITAVGAGAEHFSGSFDNTQVPLRILKLMQPDAPESNQPAVGEKPAPAAAADNR